MQSKQIVNFKVAWAVLGWPSPAGEGRDEAVIKPHPPSPSPYGRGSGTPALNQTFNSYTSAMNKAVHHSYHQNKMKLLK
jgi:hypothetical protein